MLFSFLLLARSYYPRPHLTTMAKKSYYLLDAGKLMALTLFIVVPRSFGKSVKKGTRTEVETRRMVRERKESKEDAHKKVCSRRCD